eukprot:6953578-Lingulodinium_polyedra.AAC.1
MVWHRKWCGTDNDATQQMMRRTNGAAQENGAAQSNGVVQKMAWRRKWRGTENWCGIENGVTQMM